MAQNTGAYFALSECYGKQIYWKIQIETFAFNLYYLHDLRTSDNLYYLHNLKTSDKWKIHLRV